MPDCKTVKIFTCFTLVAFPHVLVHSLGDSLHSACMHRTTGDINEKRLYMHTHIHVYDLGIEKFLMTGFDCTA